MTSAEAKNSLDQGILTEYLKIQKEFSEISCKHGIEESYNDLDTQYRGDGNFIPVLLDQKVDQKVIKSNLALMKEKITWIRAEAAELKQTADLSVIFETLKRLENEVVLLQEAKKDYFFAKNKKDKDSVMEKSEKQFAQMMKEVETLRGQAAFLLSFKFPLNHLDLRAEYDKYKVLSTKEARAKANAVYFYRKIVQDGSYDDKLTRNDSVVRAAFDTLYLSLYKEKNRSFLSENERSDFKYVINSFRNMLELGKANLLSRYDEWAQRSERSLQFYQNLAEGKKIKDIETNTLVDVSKMLEEKARALYNLKEFVLKKESDAYEYWSKKSELFQYLYTLETILYSEVGRLDAPDALERRDVAQVVINRFTNSFYSELSEKDGLYDYVSARAKVKENKWLNVLFKDGEFSFTYFYIPGNLHIYCPDMSKVGQYLRRENVRIALELLNRPRTNFPALRYFSRMSMYGRIEMDSLWEDYKAMPEVPGKPVKNHKKLATLFRQDRYKYLYDFQAEDKKKTYLVVEMQGKTYVVDYNNPKQIYYYRSPHQFRYFAPVKS